jgi:hypothetical protein
VKRSIDLRWSRGGGGTFAGRINGSDNSKRDDGRGRSRSDDKEGKVDCASGVTDEAGAESDSGIRFTGRITECETCGSDEKRVFSKKY